MSKIHYRKLINDALTRLASNLSCDANRFRREGFTEFINSIRDDHDPLDIVVNFLDYYSDCDGEWRSLIGSLAVQFVQYTPQKIDLQAMLQAAAELKSMLEAGSLKREQIEAWATRRY